MNRLKIAQYIALGGMAISVIGFLVGVCGGIDVGSFLMGIGFLTGIASYFFGGFLTALKIAGKIAKWGWIIVPFPYDIGTFILAFAFSIFVFLFLPIIPIRKAYTDSQFDY